MRQSYGQAALAVARRELGVKEHPPGSNDGPRVRVYTRGRPEPWCADFIEWALEQVGWTRGTWNTAYVPSWVSAARNRDHAMRVLDPLEEPRPGDLAALDFQGDGEPDHIVVIETITSPDTWGTIEGNTAVGNDSNGGEVMRRTRSRSQAHAIIRLPLMPARTLSQRLRAAGYGGRTIRVILRNLKAGISGNVARPSDRERFQRLRSEGLSARSARKVIRSIRKRK